MLYDKTLRGRNYREGEEGAATPGIACYPTNPIYKSFAAGIPTWSMEECRAYIQRLERRLEGGRERVRASIAMPLDDAFFGGTPPFPPPQPAVVPLPFPCEGPSEQLVALPTYGGEEPAPCGAAGGVRGHAVGATHGVGGSTLPLSPPPCAA